MSTTDSKFRARGPESRQKTGEMSHFCLPPTPNSARAASKVDKKRDKCSFLSTGLSKFGPRGSESRTKSPKIGKMFYSVTFAKAVRSQITGKSTANQKSPFCSQHNSGAVIEQMMRSTVFGKITAVYGHIDENGRFVRKWTVPKMAITDKMGLCPYNGVN